MNNTFLLFYSPKSRNQSTYTILLRAATCLLLYQTILLRAAGILRYISKTHTWYMYTTVFCKISIRRSKYCLEFSIS